MLIDYVLFRKRRAKSQIQPGNVHVIARNPPSFAIYNYVLLLNAPIYLSFSNIEFLERLMCLIRG